MNDIKTFALLAALSAILVLLGGFMGGQAGIMVALLFCGGMNFFAYWYSDTMLLKMYNAEPLEPSHFVFMMVSQLSERGGIPMPKVFLINDPSPNAFATGRNPENASIAITTGLMDSLNRAEIKGVLAHEMAHVLHRDTLLSTITATFAGAISGIANMLMWTNIFSNHHDGESSANPIVQIAMMIFAPLAASLIQMAISRSREFEADKGGVMLCGEPMALANALLKIEQCAHNTTFKQAESHPASAHLFIINPLRGEKLMELFQTHPLTAERVKRLRLMT
mgnify:CR=1 FL=1|tara:strand:- start:944 stop:1783 length:840 start_codon:yes stop_codon:yes gene_type:complete